MSRSQEKVVSCPDPYLPVIFFLVGMGRGFGYVTKEKDV